MRYRVKKWLKGIKIRDSGVNPYVILTASSIFQKDIKNFDSSRWVMYVSRSTDIKKCQIIICQPLKPMSNTLVDYPIRDKDLSIK
ncbi:MAG: hypothetical protein WBZ20_07205 [Nitrososphaeraceae archaeon]